MTAHERFAYWHVNPVRAVEMVAERLTCTFAEALAIVEEDMATLSMPSEIVVSLRGDQTKLVGRAMEAKGCNATVPMDVAREAIIAWALGVTGETEGT